MKSLYFIRHGESQANVDDVWGGQIETPLTQVGIAQAQHAGRKAKLEGLKFDIIISSPLSRATDTAKFVAQEIGYPKESIVYNKLLLERSFGILDGTPNAKSFFDSHEYKDLDNVEEAETVEELQNRAEKSLHVIMKRPEDSILVVGHGAFGRALRRVVNKQPYTDEFTKDWSSSYIPNAEIFQLI
ncbi:histidine phosphatase family protein [Candidatus Saccharibacteria bacterium]|nr:histidine phosphatase family protein [Candidatus Saccharibacteria bacterium]